MIVSDYEILIEHIGHKIVCLSHERPDDGTWPGCKSISIECTDCDKVLYFRARANSCYKGEGPFAEKYKISLSPLSGTSHGTMAGTYLSKKKKWKHHNNPQAGIIPSGSIPGWFAGPKKKWKGKGKSYFSNVYTESEEEE